jgi:hypothetical protein
MITISTSSTKDLLKPSLEQIHFLLFEDPNVWSSIPDASLTYRGPESIAKLILAHAENRGYYIQFVQNLNQLWVLVHDRNQLEGEVVEIDTDYLVSEGLLCPYPVAWEAVKFFSTTGGRSPSFDWASDHDLPSATVF